MPFDIFRLYNRFYRLSLFIGAISMATTTILPLDDRFFAMLHTNPTPFLLRSFDFPLHTQQLVCGVFSCFSSIHFIFSFSLRPALALALPPPRSLSRSVFRRVCTALCLWPLFWLCLQFLKIYECIQNGKISLCEQALLENRTKEAAAAAAAAAQSWQMEHVRKADRAKERQKRRICVSVYVGFYHPFRPFFGVDFFVVAVRLSIANSSQQPQHTRHNSM